MLTLARRFGVAALATVAMLGVEVPGAHAQVVLPNSQSLVNPYFRVAPNLPLNQAAYNTRVMGRAYASVPPWLYGYNPYPSPIYTQSPYPYPPYPGPFYGDPGSGYGGGAATLSTSPYGYGGGYGGGYGSGSLYSNPGSGYGGGYGGGYGYGGYGYSDPFAGYLSGGAQVIQAQGQFMMQRAQSNLLNEQLRQMQIDTHRKILDEWSYERNFYNNLEPLRVQEQRYALKMALNNPPLTEILAGESLNSILNNIIKLEDKETSRPMVPLDEDLLKDINLTNGDKGNIGLLKKSGRLSWPLSLQGAAYETERKRITQLAQDAVKQVEFTGKVDEGTMQTLLRDAATMNEKLRENMKDMTPSQAVDARRYLNQLDDALTALQQPNVRNFFNGNWQPKGKTVSDLVKNLGGGLKFNAATQGDEVAYRMLQQRLTAYNMALEQHLAQK